MNKAILLAFVLIIFNSCEKLDSRFANNVSGTYQAREITMQGNTIFLPDNQSGLSIDMYVDEISNNRVKVRIEATISGLREYANSIFQVDKDGSRYILTSIVDGSIIEVSNNEASISETINGEKAEIRLRKL